MPPTLTQNLLATMVTTTTYGTWLPGELRGYVENGIILPGNPKLFEHASGLMKAEPVFLNDDEQVTLFDAIKRAADEFQYTLLAVSIESWHAHWLIDHGFDKVETMVGRLKTRMRQALGRGRIWTNGYDARYCFDRGAVNGRRGYIRGHRGWRRLPYELADGQ